MTSGIYTDMYQLVMMQAYLEQGKSNVNACFDYFFRSLPFGGGFVVFAGLDDLLQSISGLRFPGEDIEYLRKYNFTSQFLDYLANFRFTGNIFSPPEGELVFPNEPVVRVEGKLAEVQLIETLLLNFLNFESLIATKAARMRLSAGDRSLSEFGLRRAQALGAIYASRAAVIGGCDTTSNVYAARVYDLNSVGTMAHSFIEAFGDELNAFRKFSESNPEGCILLVDTYDTLNSGIPNAITAAKEMEKKNRKLFGIRLDSGDLAYLSRRSRQMLDDAGLHYVKIVASNRLDEYVIKSLIEQGSPVDIFGVGTSLVVGEPDGALDGVYKLSMSEGKPRLKLSENLVKITLPAVKKVYRYYDDEGFLYADAITLGEEDKPSVMFHPFDKEKYLNLHGKRSELLLKQVMKDGEVTIPRIPVYEIKKNTEDQLKKLQPEYKRFQNPHVYKIGLSEKLLKMRDDMRGKFKQNLLR